MSPSKTTIDWLRFRTQASVLAGLEAIRPLFGTQAPKINLKALERGKDGFQQACAVRLDDWELGRVDFGGDSQRGWVRWNLTGIGCESVTDWDALSECESLPGSEIRRADIALTTWSNQVQHETVVDAHQLGRFTCGGRPPALQQIISSDPLAGRTCYVGKRDSEKFFRGYEKGFELAGKMRSVGGRKLTHLLGQGAEGQPMLYPVEGIYRCEVELKTEGRTIPWEVIHRRDQYFSGCYPFLADLLPEVECDILMRRPERAPQMSLAAALENCRIQYGATLFTALKAYHGDMGKVFELIIGRHDNEELVAAGVLAIEHPEYAPFVLS